MIFGMSLEGFLGWTCFVFIALLVGIGYVISSAVTWLMSNETVQEIATEVGKEVAGQVVEDTIDDYFWSLFE